MSEPSVIETMESLLEELDGVETSLKQEQLDIDKEIKAVKDQHAPRVDPLTERRDSLVEKISKLFVDHQDELTEGTGKTVVFRGGTLSSRLAAAALVVDDETVAMRYLRRVGKLRKFTKLGKRTLDKVALKKDPAFVAKAPGMHMEQDENLTIKLPKADSEIVRKLNPLRSRIGKRA